MVIAVLIISILNLIASGVLIDLVIRYKIEAKKNEEQNVSREAPEEKSEAPVYQDVPDSREDTRTFYGLARNLQQKWCDLEDDDER